MMTTPNQQVDGLLTQLGRLDDRLGANKGAQRERKRLRNALAKQGLSVIYATSGNRTLTLLTVDASQPGNYEATALAVTPQTPLSATTPAAVK